VWFFLPEKTTDQLFVSVASDQQLYGDNKTTVVKAYPDNQDAMQMLP
jgi:hypothetical protein